MAEAFPKGARVSLHGLVARPELNSQIAEVVGPANESGRIPVTISAGARVQNLLLKSTNLTIVDSPETPKQANAETTSSLTNQKPSKAAPLPLPSDISPMWSPPSLFTQLLTKSKGSGTSGGGGGAMVDRGDVALDAALLDSAARRVVGGSEGAWRQKDCVDEGKNSNGAARFEPLT